jgi:uncharacterized protein
MSLFVNKSELIALIGASNNKEKFGNKLFLNLLNKGFQVVPINPKESKIEGKKAFSSITLVPDKSGLVIFVVPPQIVVSELEKVKNLGIGRVWFQPGSESQEAIDFCEKNSIEYVSNACIMVESN